MLHTEDAVAITQRLILLRLRLAARYDRLDDEENAASAGCPPPGLHVRWHR